MNNICSDYPYSMNNTRPFVANKLPFQKYWFKTHKKGQDYETD